jgi:xyloglucan-specific exo-beta-1,4-glucanase
MRRPTTEPHAASRRSFLRTTLLGLYVGMAQAAVPHFPHYVWNNVTVGGGGFSPNIIFSPVEPGLAYLRTDIGGIYRYEQNQQRWIALQDGMAEGNYFGVESVAPDPGNAQVVYAAVGMYGSGPAAILRSDDRGTTWNIFPVPFRMGGNEDGRGLGERLAIDPHDTNIVYFGSRHDGLQRSVDRGRSWLRVTTFPAAGLGRPAPNQTHAGVSFVLLDPRSGPDNTPTSTLFAGVADPGQHHLFRSIDAGASWQPVPGEPRADLLPVRAQLASNGILYLTYSNGVGPNGITDGAVFALDTSNLSWHDLTPPTTPPGPAGGFMGLAVDAQRPDTLLVATIDRWRDRDSIWRSTDAGQHWESLRPRSEIDASASPFLRWGEAHADFGWWIAGVAIDPFNSNHIAYTTGATLYASDQPLPAAGSQRILWRPWVSGIEETAILALASPPLGPPLLSGFGDIGGFAHEDLHVSPPTLFTNPIFDNTRTLEFAGQAPNVVVRSGRLQHGSLPVAAWSQDFARSWTPLQLPPATEEPTAPPALTGYHRGEIDAVVAVSADGATFIAMTRVPMLTRDRGQHWIAVRGLPDFARVVADRLDAQRFYALDFGRSRIAVSEDGGQSFAFLASSGFPKQHVCEGRPARAEDPWPLLATPGRAGDLWLVCHGELYHSLDGGRSFTERRGDLAVTALAFGKPRADGDYPTLFAIGTRGDLEAIWRSDNAGASWLRINDAEHEYGRRFRVICADQRVFGRVYVGTDGRGVLYGEPSP